jgi:tryptophan synthase beta chain
VADPRTWLLAADTKDYVGRESLLYFSRQATFRVLPVARTGPHIYLKREDLNHTGAHKINNSRVEVAHEKNE